MAAEKDIVLCWRCTLHVASSGIHWGQLNATPSSITLDDIHMGIKSLRNLLLTILELVDPFVQEYARLNRDPPADAQHIEVLWRVLGVSGHMLTIVVEMDPFWNAADRVLEVSRRFEFDPKRYEKVANVLFFLQVVGLLGNSLGWCCQVGSNMCGILARGHRTGCHLGIQAQANHILPRGLHAIESGSQTVPLHCCNCSTATGKLRAKFVARRSFLAECRRVEEGVEYRCWIYSGFAYVCVRANCHVIQHGALRGSIASP